MLCAALSMRDALRNYRMTIRRKELSDTESESQPLLTSYSSTSSFGALQHECMFPDSETTDCEAEGRTRSTLVLTPPTTRPMYRRSFCYPGSYEPALTDILTTNENTYIRYQYFAKGNAFVGDKPLFYRSLLNITYKDWSEAENPHAHSSIVTIFAVWNTIMGTSLLAMSWGLEKAGLFPGMVLILLVGAVCLYTSYLLLKVNEDHGLIGQNNEVSDLCRMLLGKWAEIVAKIFSLVVLIGANIVYWILMSNFLYNSVEFLYDYTSSKHVEETLKNDTVICPKQAYYNRTLAGNATFANDDPSIFERIWDLHSTVPVFLGLGMFPLLNFKSPSFFAKFNSLGTLSAMYLILFVAIKSFTWGVHIPDWNFEFNLKPTFSALSGMLSLSFFIHNIIISIMKNNRHQENNGRDLSIAYGLVTFTYLFTGVVFYISFPLAKACIEDNILNNFDRTDVLAIIARLLLLFQLFTVFPLISYMLRMDVFSNINMIFRNYRFGDFTYTKVMILNALIVLVCILFACFLPRIGTLIRYTGALSGLVYIFMLPSLLKIASLRKEKALTNFKLTFYVFIIILGFFNMFSQFFITDY